MVPAAKPVAGRASARPTQRSPGHLVDCVRSQSRLMQHYLTELIDKPAIKHSQVASLKASFAGLSALWTELFKHVAMQDPGAEPKAINVSCDADCFAYIGHHTAQSTSGVGAMSEVGINGHHGFARFGNHISQFGMKDPATELKPITAGHIVHEVQVQNQEWCKEVSVQTTAEQQMPDKDLVEVEKHADTPQAHKKQAQLPRSSTECNASQDELDAALLVVASATSKLATLHIELEAAKVEFAEYRDAEKERWARARAAFKNMVPDYLLALYT